MKTEYNLFDAELDAIQSLQALFEAAGECKRLHERARMPIPAALQRFFAISATVNKKADALTKPPEKTPRPHEVPSDWISINVRDAYATTLTLAVMRETGLPMRPKDIVTKVQELNPQTSSGAIYNLGKRLDGTALVRGDEGWELVNADTAPVLQDDLVWNDPDNFTSHELAAHRRDAIMYLLGLFRMGQQTSQLIELLQSCAWLKAPVSKELVQDDVEILSKDGKIKRRGASKKWELVASKN